MINETQIELAYNLFYQSKYLDHKFSIKRTQVVLKLFASFLALVDKEYSLQSVGVDFIWQYFLFQFNYWNELSLNNKFSDKIVLPWIIGKKAFERWKERDQDYDWQIESYKIIEAYGLDKRTIHTLLNSKATKVVIEKPKGNQAVPLDFSSRKRAQFLNTDRGFAICIEMTTLYDPIDPNCAVCQFKDECKEILRVTYPHLYSQRKL